MSFEIGRDRRNCSEVLCKKDVRKHFANLDLQLNLQEVGDDLHVCVLNIQVHMILTLPELNSSQLTNFRLFIG